MKTNLKSVLSVLLAIVFTASSVGIAAAKNGNGNSGRSGSSGSGHKQESRGNSESHRNDGNAHAANAIRKQMNDDIHASKDDIRNLRKSLNGYFMTGLAPSSNSTVNRLLNGFERDLKNLDKDLKRALRDGSSTTGIRASITATTDVAIAALTPFIKPDMVAAFPAAMRDIANKMTSVTEAKQVRKFLKPADERRIQAIIAGIEPARREAFLRAVLANIVLAVARVNASNATDAQKARTLGLLEEIRVLIQAKLDEITGTPPTDVFPPVVTNFSVSGSTSTTATVRLTSDEAGTGSYVVVLSGAAAPSAAQVMAGQNANGSAAAIQGKFAITSGANQTTVAGLASGTAYVLHFVASDASGNAQIAPVSASFSTPVVTPADTTAPVTSALSITGTTSTGTAVSVTSNESGTGWYVVLSAGATPPTAAQAMAGQDAAGNAATLRGSFSLTGGANQASVSGLSANTAYVLYFVAGDMAGNVQPTASSVNFSTLVTPDTTAPIINSLSVSGTTSSGTTVVVNVNEAGTGSYVVLPSGATAPTAVQVVAGQNAAGAAVALSGSVALAVGNNSAPVTGLIANTAYVLYFAVRDMAGNLQSAVSSVSFSTPQ